MPKERTHGLKRDAKRAAIIKDTADLVGVSPRLVNMVLNTERENETVVSVFMGLSEKYDEVLEEFRNDMPNWTTILTQAPKPYKPNRLCKIGFTMTKKRASA